MAAVNQSVAMASWTATIFHRQHDKQECEQHEQMSEEMK
jgi:hypothetical protein